eukprot:TRINITY_DN1684_c0_g3_i1.p1 TRINITY_DN1684_c0_g3~~TRINITY_DN1684_c0_g3_i1.p1  ORF type:complete len:167 (-),score=43.58 TRINITY_DN1684_c0_g3_i1:2-502(-)
MCIRDRDREIFCKICNAPDPFCPECLCLHLKTHNNTNLAHISTVINDELQSMQDLSKERKEQQVLLTDYEKSALDIIKNCSQLKEEATQDEKEIMKKLEKKTRKVSILESEIRRESEDLLKEISNYAHNAKVNKEWLEAEAKLINSVKEKKYSTALTILKLSLIHI